MSFNYEQDWKKPVIRTGIITLIVASITSFIPAIYLTVGLGIVPEVGAILKAWGMVLSIFGALYIIEPVTFYSALGLSGTYLSFLSGNIGNMRVPCSIMGMEVTNTTPGSRKAEVISTLAICGSIIMNLVMLTVMAFIGSQIIAALPVFIVDGFRSYTIPSVYGAMFAQTAIKSPKLAPFGVAIPLILLLIGVPSHFVIMLTVFFLILISKFFYNNQGNKSSAIEKELG